MRCTSCIYYMICICTRYNARSDWVAETYIIVHFTVIGLVTWPLNGSEAGVDLVLMQTALILLCE